MRISDWSSDVCSSDLNAEPEPPDRELRQVVEPVGAGEGNAVVRADGVGQAALLEQALKDRNDASPFHALEGFAGENEPRGVIGDGQRSEEHTSELQSLLRISYAVFCLTKKTKQEQTRR